jgi:hypothetical protein
LSRRHDLAYTYRAVEHALPWASWYSKRRTRKKDRRWRSISREQLCELIACIATED